MKLRQLSETTLNEKIGWADIEELALDVIGAIPGAEPADVLNGIRLTQRGDYISAALSFISVVPTVGDVIGKGLKIIFKTGKASPKLIKFIMKNGPDAWKYAKKVIKNLKVLDKHGDKLDQAFNSLLEKIQQQSEQRNVANA